MAHLIRDGAVVEGDPWALVLEADASLPGGDVVVPLERFLVERDALLARDGAVGIFVDSDQDVRRLEGLLDGVALIAVNFPKFADGRGYSLARILRDELGWGGRLRAVGDILFDQLFYLSRCGFDEFALREDKDPQDALRAFGTFSAVYQPASDNRDAVLHPER